MSGVINKIPFLSSSRFRNQLDLFVRFAKIKAKAGKQQDQPKPQVELKMHFSLL
jgi:hypothetical protein